MHISSKHNIAVEIGPWLLYGSALAEEEMSSITNYLIQDQDKC